MTRIDNRLVSKEIARWCYEPGMSLRYYCLKLMIEEMVLPKELGGYTDKELEEYIYKFLEKNNVDIEAMWRKSWS